MRSKLILPAGDGFLGHGCFHEGSPGRDLPGEPVFVWGYGLRGGIDLLVGGLQEYIQSAVVFAFNVVPEIPVPAVPVMSTMPAI